MNGQQSKNTLCKILGHKMYFRGDVSKTFCKRCGYKEEVKWHTPEQDKPRPENKPMQQKIQITILDNGYLLEHSSGASPVRKMAFESLDTLLETLGDIFDSEVSVKGSEKSTVKACRAPGVITCVLKGEMGDFACHYCSWFK